MKIEIAPLVQKPIESKPWEGSLPIKPWHYRVTVVIPVWNLTEQIKTAVKLWSLQTIKPYILLVDTGSDKDKLQEIEALRSDNVEIHSIRQHGCLHPTDFVTVAMDLAMALCRSDYMLCTHQDIYPRKQTVIEELLDLKKPVVGYHISQPRFHDDTDGMIGHQLTLLDMKVMDKIGAFWSGRKLLRNMGIENHKPVPERTWFPDTELALNYCLREHKIKPHIIGKEVRDEHYEDEYISHFRAITAAHIYHAHQKNKILEWMEKAQDEADENLKKWKHKDKPSLSIVTAASRSELVKKIKFDASSFNYEWLILPDLKFTTAQKCERDDAKIIHLPKCDNAGGVMAKNKGAKVAKNDWLFFLDDDGLVFPNFFHIAAHHINQNPDAKILIFNVKRSGGYTDLKADSDNVKIGFIDLGSYMIRRDIFEPFQKVRCQDGILIEKLYQQYKDNTVFVDEYSIHWNGLSEPEHHNECWIKPTQKHIGDI